jgi:hypothetical protein
MAHWPKLALLMLVALVAFTPAQVEARAGGAYSFHGGGSFMSQGSRGFRSYDTPLQRSMAPRPTPGFGASAPYYGYGTYHPFWSGLAGAFFGSWLGHLLFPYWGYGGYGFGSVFGSIFSLLIILWLVRMGMRAMMGGSMFASMGGGPLYGGLGAAPFAAAPPRGAPLAIAGADYGEFERILKQVQQAWGNADLASLRQVMTPEMLSYFSETLAQNQSNGVQNRIENVELVRGDLREAWDEGPAQYATCYLRWRAVDYTVRLDRHPGEPDYVVDGDPRQPSEAAELWTFMRSPGGRWLLSAIQQA